MAVTLNPLYSKYGFKGPGFTVDSEGNVQVKSLSSEVLITDIAVTQDDTSTIKSYDITESAGQFAVDGVSPNPAITVVKGRTYRFNIDLTALSWNIRDSLNVDVNTGISHTVDGVTTTGTGANNVQDGYVEWTVPASGTGFYYSDIDGDPFKLFVLEEPSVTGTGTFTSLIVTGTSELRGEVTINDDVNLNELLKVHNTTNSTSSSTGAVVIKGGVGIEKDVHIAGDLIAKSFKSNDVGVPTLSNNAVVFKVEGVERGRITSLGSDLRIINTTINDTVIGNSGPAEGTFTNANIKNTPTNADHAATKQYVDSADIVFSIAFGA
jgi:hypothetical protein